MKIDKVIMSCNDNPFYSDYWPAVSRVWKEKFDIEPVLVYVGSDASRMSTEYGTVVQQEKLEDVPDHTQAQWARYWYTQFEPDTMWLLSDIDMLPLSTDYFVRSLEHIPREIDPVIHFNTNATFDVASNKWNLEGDCIQGGVCMPTCYSAATGRRRKNILDLVPSFAESIEKLKWQENDYHHAPDGKNGVQHWYAEEAYQSVKMKDFIRENPHRFFSIGRLGGFCGNRLDRGHSGMPEWNPEWLKAGVYMDFHMPRPWSEFGDRIQEVVDCYLEGVAV
tara:strand:- start:1594 stop:2427 length:834 start_codon:yes stop_codon:yes gene_type:complete